MISAIITNLNFELYHMNVKTVFLNGKLEKEIYMKQHISLAKKGQKNKVYRLLWDPKDY